MYQELTFPEETDSDRAWLSSGWARTDQLMSERGSREYKPRKFFSREYKA